MIIYNFIKNLILYIRYTRILKTAYREERLVDKINIALNTNFSMDWIGRLYTVLNPLIQDMNRDPADGTSSIIYDMTVDGKWSNKTYIEKWIMDRMNFMNSFVQENALWDLIVYRITELEDNNYLVVFEPEPWEELKKWSKRFFALIFAIIIISISILIIL